MLRSLVLAGLTLALLANASHGAARGVVPIPPAAEILRTLRPEHPRLLATSNDFVRLKEKVAGDPLLKNWHARLQREGGNLLSAAPSKYEIPDGKRLLATSRRVLDRVQTLALLYRLDGDARWAERAWKELEAAANFKDWNPKHFLDTAEMTRAFATGYDWLYDYWTPARREVLRQAMVEKGIRPAMPIVDKGDKGTWWASASHNWNQVCNGGIGMGALALAEVEPELAAAFLSRSLKSLQLPMAEFAPDGAWIEGPGYWNYATAYNVAYLAALQTALGTDFGLAEMPAFDQTGFFAIQVCGPTGVDFNYADAGAGRLRAPQMFWLASRFKQPVFAAVQEAHAEGTALDLLWGATRPPRGNQDRLPTAAWFRGSEVVLLRGAWDDPQTTFVAFKAGRNGVNHGHLDLGTFVLESLGQRWAVDLGSDDYNLPDYFGGKRWDYYRLRAEGHNTLVLDPARTPDQNTRAATRITKFEPGAAKSFGIADLTEAYAGKAKQVNRGIALLAKRDVLVQDEIVAAQPGQLFWFMHTPAKIKLASDRRSAQLTLGGKILTAKLLSPADAKFSTLPASPLPTSPDPSGQQVNRGLTKLTVKLDRVTDTRLAVLFTPAGGDAAIKPLAEW